MSHSWIPLLNLTSRRFTVRRIRVTEEKTEGKDPPLETEDQMKDIDQTPEIEVEEKEGSEKKTKLLWEFYEKPMASKYVIRE